MTITLTFEQIHHLLTALMRMEDKLTGSLTTDECWATVALAQEVGAPAFITEYFARKANEAKTTA